MKKIYVITYRGVFLHVCTSKKVAEKLIICHIKDNFFSLDDYEVKERPIWKNSDIDYLDQII